MKALRKYASQALHHFTRFDQVDLLVRASEGNNIVDNSRSLSYY